MVSRVKTMLAFCRRLLPRWRRKYDSDDVSAQGCMCCVLCRLQSWLDNHKDDLVFSKSNLLMLSRIDHRSQLPSRISHTHTKSLHYNHQPPHIHAASFQYTFTSTVGQSVAWTSYSSSRPVGNAPANDAAAAVLAAPDVCPAGISCLLAFCFCQAVPRPLLLLSCGCCSWVCAVVAEAVAESRNGSAHEFQEAKRTHSGLLVFRVCKSITWRSTSRLRWTSFVCSCRKQTRKSWI